MTHDEPQLHQPMHQPVYDRRSPQNMPCAEHTKTMADHEKRVSLTEQAVMSIKQTSEGMTTKLDLILAQITRVAILEEKHSTQQIDVTRAHAKIEVQAEKLEKLGDESRAFMNYQRGRDKILWSIGAVVFGLFVKALFFASSHGMTP